MATTKLKVDYCKRCKTQLEPGKLKCKGCSLWNMTDPERPGIESEWIALSDVMSTSTRRYRTGLIDHVLGGGLVLTSNILLAGSPGAGKSTLSLQLCDVLAPQLDAPIMYIAAEEGEGDIRARGDRLGLEHMADIRIVPALGGLPDELEDLLDLRSPGAVILDSLPGITNGDEQEGSAICKTLKTYADAHHCPAIILDHITKEGDFAGPMKLAHAVDAVFMFTFEESDPLGVRTLTGRKNRHGAAPRSVEYLHGEAGVSTREGHRLGCRSVSCSSGLSSCNGGAPTRYGSRP